MHMSFLISSSRMSCVNCHIFDVIPANSMKVPQMNRYPDTQSVFVLDNCRIHHTDLLQEVLNENGTVLTAIPQHSLQFLPRHLFACLH